MSAETVEAPQAEPVKRDPVQEMMDNLQSHTYDTDLAEFPLHLKGKVLSGDFIIRELTGEQRSDYINFQTLKAKFGPDGKVTGIKDVKGLESLIVSMSLYGPDGNAVPEAIIKRIPGKLLKDLAAVAMRISGLDEKAQEQAKNS